MKSLIVHPDTSMLGGGEIVCALAIHALVSHGSETSLATETPRGGVVAELIRKRGHANVHIIPLGGVTVPFLATYPKLLAVRRELSSLREVDADIVVSTQTLLPIMHTRAEQKHVLYVHYPSMRTLEATRESRLREAYLTPMRIYLESYLRTVDVILCNSRFTRQAILRYWDDFSLPEPSVVYPSTLRDFDSSAGFEGRIRRCVSIGRLTRYKGHENMKKLAAELPNIEFVSAGSSVPAYDPYIKELSRGKPNNYTILANASEARISELLERSRLYVHCAREEHFGISVLESMKAGCVPLVHASGGPAELVPRCLQWSSLEDLSAKCQRLCSDATEWRRWHQAVLAAAKEFTPERFSEDFSRAVLAQ